MANRFNMLVFLELLLRASHKAGPVTFRSNGVWLEPGQCMITIRSLAEALDVKKNKIERSLANLKKADTIATESRTPGLLITICNWSEYQEPEKPHRTPGKKKTGRKPDTEQEREEDIITDSELDSEPIDQLALIDLPSDGKVDFEGLFEAWWLGWTIKGTKRGKGKARPKFIAILKKRRATLAELTEGLQRYMAHCDRNQTPLQFIKQPEGWLNGERWKDDLADNQPDDRPKRYGVKSPEQLARDLADELDRTDGHHRPADGMADEPFGFGQGDRQHAHGQDGPEPGASGDGEGDNGIPGWFDQIPD